LPEFSVIGKVSAVDPDLAENAQVKYYSQMNPYFDVNSDTGEVYLKKSASFLFDLNETELAFEVKAIDSGVKLNLINNLIKQNQSVFDDLNESDEFNRRLVEIGSLLDQKKQLQISSSMSQAASFEAAQVRFVLNRNLAQIYEAMSTYPSLRPVDVPLAAPRRR
jgi:hypothetical protein